MPSHLARARAVAQQSAAHLVAGGAEAVVLVGSVARGDALPTSDIDLVALGSGPHYRLHVHDDRQVSVSWRTPADVRAGFHSPAEAGGAVPAWRGALILADSTGVAAQLQAEARAWDWSLVSTAADAWVADQVTGFAEEVHRLVGQSTSGSPRTAAVMRSLLAVRLPVILAVHHRILYDTENRLWDLVAHHEGPHWTLLQDSALALPNQPAGGGWVRGDEANRAALELYGAVVARTGHLLDDEQRAVAQRALTVARAVQPESG